jgi:arabinofuranan 3-O-arabinosyltransferase
VLAGLLIGGLTYKPQFGILLPVALVAAGQWRAIASAAATAVLLAAASVAAFGRTAWEAFPQALVGQGGEVLVVGGRGDDWGYIQTVYGLIRYLDGGAVSAWFAQGITTFSVATIVYLVWRSRVRYALKAATLSAAALLATPYALIALFGVSLAILVAMGSVALGAIVSIALFCVILRRVLIHDLQPAPLATFA